MTILIAPDSFKGSMAAEQVTEAIERGIKRVDERRQCIRLPMADGGEGTVQSMVSSTNGKIVRTAPVTHPLNGHVAGSYGVMGDGETAVIELATASGIDLIHKNDLNPMKTTTRGTGEIIRHALDDGYRRFIICLGGSATNDGGTGLLSALGAKFLDDAGKVLSDGGGSLIQLASIDLGDLDKRLAESEVSVANDVSNPLTGENGAAHIFGPQKGATMNQVKDLDAALARFASVAKVATGRDIDRFPGAGAAGGTAAGLSLLPHVSFQPGIELIKNTLSFDQILKEKKVSLIITGEGKIDGQTAQGKVVSGVCQSAKPLNIPVIALAGAVDEPLDSLYEIGLTAAFSIVNGPMSLDASMEDTGDLLEQVTTSAVRLLHIDQ